MKLFRLTVQQYAVAAIHHILFNVPAIKVVADFGVISLICSFKFRSLEEKEGSERDRVHAHADWNWDLSLILQRLRYLRKLEHFARTHKLNIGYYVFVFMCVWCVTYHIRVIRF